MKPIIKSFISNTVTQSISGVKHIRYKKLVQGAESHLGNMKITSAISLLNKAIQIYPRLEMAYLSRGRAYMIRQEIMKPAKGKINSYSNWPLKSLNDIVGTIDYFDSFNIKSNCLNMAIRDFSSLIKIREDDLRLIRKRLHLKEYRQSYNRKTVKGDSTIVCSYYCRGLAYEENFKFKFAKKDFEKAYSLGSKEAGRKLNSFHYKPRCF